MSAMLKKSLCFILFVWSLSCMVAGTGYAQSAGPDLLNLIRVSDPVNFCGEPAPLHVPEIMERMEQELLLSVGNRPQVILWIKRAARYFPFIEKSLKQHGMPDDLKYMAVAESALRIHAVSVKDAKGIWQFMEATGRRYRLKIDNEKDERLNYFTATNAALAYLRDLHALLGSWTLAAAAYNMGEAGLQAEMLIQKVDDYYRLYLPLETQRYVFRILAIKLILADPAKYGFHLTAEDLYKPESFDQIEIDLPQDMPLQLIAAAAATDFKAIKDLNPEIRGYYIAAGAHRLLIPVGGAEDFRRRLDALFNQWLQDREAGVYIVRKGDNLSAIAERFNVPLQALLIWNRTGAKKPIHPGDRLVVFPNSKTMPAAVRP